MEQGKEPGQTKMSEIGSLTEDPLAPADATRASDLLQHSRCERILRAALSDSPLIVFITDALKRVGCPLHIGQIRCAPCEDPTIGAIFDHKTGLIKICEDNIQATALLVDAIAHELIHAYDQCRAHVSWDSNPYHVACSEIRAANLSGDCRWSREFMRGNWANLAGQHQVCVRRRALLSLLQSDALRNLQISDDKMRRGFAEKVVDKVFPACFADTAPFIDIP